MEHEIKITKDLKIKYIDLMKDVDIKSEFTLMDIFDIIYNTDKESDKDPEYIQMPIMQRMVCGYMKEMYQEIKSKKFNPIRKFSHLQLSLNLEKMEDDEFNLYWTFDGVGKDKKGKIIKYAIEFEKLYKLSGYPIKIHDKMCVFDYKNGKYNYKEIITSYSITLLDVLYEIFWELTFCGSPKDRDDKSKELLRRLKDVKSGKAKLIPADEVFKKLKEKYGVESSEKKDKK